MLCMNDAYAHPCLQSSNKPALSQAEARAKAEDLMRKAKERREKEEKERGEGKKVHMSCHCFR